MPEPREEGELAAPDRSARERARRAHRDHRRQWQIVIVAIVAGLIAASLGSSRDPSARALSPSPTTTGPKPVAARSVLIAHVAKNHTLDLLAVAGFDAGGKIGSVVFVPTATLVEVPSFDSEALLNVPQLGSSSLLATTVANALGLHFHEVIVVGNDRLADLLAPASHLDVNFDQPVQVNDDAGTLAFTAGHARISSADATRLLIGPTTGGGLEHLVAVQAVLQGWFARLREPRVADATVKASWLTRSLVALAHAHVGFDTLPVDTLSSGSVTRYELQQPAARTLLRSDFPYAVIGTGARPRVEILNGTGAVALTQAVAAKIVPAGGEITLTGNVPGFGVHHTSVVYYRPDDLPAARRVAAALGVGSVALGNVPLDVVDLTVVVGSDFHPHKH
jgi:hypothetical protein